MLCIFGKKYGVDIPEGPIVEYEPPDITHLDELQRRKIRERMERGVGVTLPERGEGDWIPLLLRKTGDKTLNELFRRVVDTFDETMIS